MLPHRANGYCKKGCTHVATISRQSSLEQGEGVRELHDDIEDEGACVASVTKAFPVQNWYAAPFFAGDESQVATQGEQFRTEGGLSATSLCMQRYEPSLVLRYHQTCAIIGCDA